MTESNIPTPGRAAAVSPNLRDVMDAFLSVKASADAALDAVVVEAETAGDTAAKRVETLKKLRTVTRGYDMAITAMLPPGWR